MSPDCGGYSPTSSLTSVVFPAPDGPTNAIVSPRATQNEMALRAGAEADECWKETSSNRRLSREVNATGCSGVDCTGNLRMASKFSSDASVSRYALIMLPSSCKGPKMKNE